MYSLAYGYHKLHHDKGLYSLKTGEIESCNRVGFTTSVKCRLFPKAT